MSDKSAIEWTDATWNIVTGCSIVSPACTNCYAMRLAGTRLKNHPTRRGLTREVNGKHVWTGDVRVNWEWIEQPFQWAKARKIFVAAHGDLFHAALPISEIATIFAVMVAAHHLRGHVFQVLSKRGDRMREVLNDPTFWEQVNAEAEAHVLERTDPLARRRDDARATLGEYGSDNPPPGVWLGVTAEDQQRADERIPDLLATPAAVRFVSCEPLLGPIDLRSLREFNPKSNPWIDALTGVVTRGQLPRSKSECGFNVSSTIPGELPSLDLIIAGGESGPNARPSHPDWFRSLRDQCAAAAVPFFFKQWGEWAPTFGLDCYCHGPRNNERLWPNSDGVSMLADGRICLRDFSIQEHKRRISAKLAHDTRAIEVDAGALADLHAMFRDETRETDNSLGYSWMYRVGKTRAGRLLDGREHNEFPRITA